MQLEAPPREHAPGCLGKVLDMSSRRRLAVPIRVRQEVQKRWESRWAGRAPHDIECGAPCIPMPDHRRPELDSGAREQLLAEARAVSNGEWRVFGEMVPLDGSPDSWRTHPLSGTSTPLEHWSKLPIDPDAIGGDVKQVWELNRHRGLLRLAQAWAIEHDPAWLAALGAYLDSWLVGNPAGFGINWTSSLEVAFRALAWTWVRGLTHQSPLWTPQRESAFASSLWLHGRHVYRYDSVHHSPNTHLTGEGLALAMLGRAWPHWEGAASWAERGDAILAEELEHQVLADGMHAELAPGYHRYTTEFYLLWLLARQRAGESIPAATHERVRTLVDALALLRRPDGRLPGIGDEDGGVTLPLGMGHPREPDPVILLGESVLGPGAAGLPSTVREGDLGWWLLDEVTRPARSDTAGSSPPPRIASLPIAGYHILRDADPDGWWCLVDAGPQAMSLPGHSHCDLGHVEVVKGTIPIVTDPGSLLYAPDEDRRDADRSSRSHATLSVNNAPLATPTGPFRWGVLGPIPSTGVSTQEGGSIVRLGYAWSAPDGTRLRHERQVLMTDSGGLVVADWLGGANGRDVTLTWPLPWGAGQVLLETGAAAIPGDITMHWFADGVAELDGRLELATFADTYRAPVAGTYLRVGGVAEQEVRLVTTIGSSGHAVQVSLLRDSVRVSQPGHSDIILRAEVV